MVKKKMNDINEIKKSVEFFDNNKSEIKSNWNETETRLDQILIEI